MFGIRTGIEVLGDLGDLGAFARKKRNLAAALGAQINTIKLYE